MRWGLSCFVFPRNVTDFQCVQVFLLGRLGSREAGNGGYEALYLLLLKPKVCFSFVYVFQFPSCLIITPPISLSSLLFTVSSKKTLVAPSTRLRNPFS